MSSYNLHGPQPRSALSQKDKAKEAQTLRLTFPSWQGGTLPLYHFGSQLLTALVPPTNGPQAQVVVSPPKQTHQPLRQTNGVNGLEENLSNLRNAKAACEEHNPDNVVVLGGDCLAELGPFAYLAEKYKKDRFGVLWIDAHPDIMNSKDWPNAHTYPVSSLLGKGDAPFTECVTTPVEASRVMIAGMHHPSAAEQQHITDYGVRVCGPEDITENGAATILKWIETERITHLAIHLDLDVLSKEFFRLLYFCDPAAPKNKFDAIPQGKLRFAHVASIVKAVHKKTNVVGFGITELLPWDVFNLREFLKELPLVNPAYASKL